MADITELFDAFDSALGFTQTNAMYNYGKISNPEYFSPVDYDLDRIKGYYEQIKARGIEYKTMANLHVIWALKHLLMRGEEYSEQARDLSQRLGINAIE